MRLWTLVTLAAIAMALAACRDVVRPGDVQQIGAPYVISGHVTGDTELDFVWRDVFVDTVAFADTIGQGEQWVIPVAPDGSFRASLPRRAGRYANFSFRWGLSKGRTGRVVKRAVDLTQPVVDLAIEVQRLRGRFVVPEGFDDIIMENADFSMVVGDPGTPTDASWFGDVDAEGRFDLVVPRQDWTLKLIHDRPDAIRTVDIDWVGLDLDQELTIEFPYESFWVRFLAPPDLPVLAYLRSNARGTSPGESWARDIFAPREAYQPVFYAVPLYLPDFYFINQGDVVATWPRPENTYISSFDPVLPDTLEFSLGEIVLDVRVTSAGAPVDAARVWIENELGSYDRRTEEEGRLLVAAPRGLTRLRVEGGPDGEVARWVDAQDSRTVEFDLGTAVD